MDEQKLPEQQTGFDATKRYVRVCEQRPDGFVEFEFAIGDPALCVELMLPEAAFREFCRSNEAIVLEPRTPGQGDWVGRMNEASQRGFMENVDHPVTGITRGDIHAD